MIERVLCCREEKMRDGLSEFLGFATEFSLSAPRQARKCVGQFRLKGRFSATRSDNVIKRWQFVLQMAERFADQTLPTIPHDRIADAARNGKAEAGAIPVAA